MGNIVLLDDLTINQIAAGEVIERPASVVKELVENSIDADAKNIVVEIKNGGKSFIKIVDNGKGIKEDDMLISLERHATSKIRSVDDLDKIYSMGFRGEALASILSVSKMTLISKTKDDTLARKIVAKAGDILEQSEVGAGIGTTIIVEDLFFNTPVRYKFLKQDATEFRYIKELIQKIALANPSISIKLIYDGKNVFYSNGNGNIHDIIYVLYGKDVTENIIDVNYEEDGIKVTGVVGNTLISKDNRKCQIFFLNKRNIRNQILTSSADQAFKASIGIGKYGFFILNIEMAANLYDINVHPTKLDVRFKDESKIYKIVYHAMKSAMLNKEFLGNNEIEENKKTYIDNELNFLTNHFVSNKSSIIKQEIPEGTKILNNNIKQIASININRNENKANNIKENDAFPESESLINRTNERHIDYKYIGILMKTYIIIEIENELYLIDQHAAHERVLYEQIKDNYKKNMKSNSQMMLIPEVINLTHKEIQFVENNIELIKSYGFDIELFGDNAVKINGMPDIEFRSKTKNVFLDVLDEMLTNERSSSKDVEERFIATVACKAAVKANMDLKPEEVDKLIRRLLNLKNPYTCPHGRPTTIKFEKNEIKK